MTKKSLLVKFLLSYLSILILPIITIISYYYPYSTAVVTDKANSWNKHATEQLMNSMDIFTRYVYNMPAEILQNREIKPYMAPVNEYQKVIIANEMRKYNVTDAFIENTLLYLNDIQYFFSKHGNAYKLNDFSNRGVGYVYKHWNIEDMQRELHQATAPYVRPAEEVIIPGGHRLNLLSFVLPLPIGGEHSPGTLLILVRESTILNMMQSNSENNNAIFIIADEQQRCLVASSTCDFINSSDFNQLLKDKNLMLADNHTLFINEEQYIVAHTISNANQWHYIRLLPVSDTIHDIRNIQLNTLLLLFTIMLMTALIIYISIRNNYQPIKRLVEFSNKLFENDHSANLNEIDTINFALNQLSSSKEKLHEQLQLTRPKLRDQLLFELLIGNYDSWEHFMEEAALYDIQLVQPYISVAIISAETDASSFAILQFCKLHHFSDQQDISYFFIKSLYNHEIILLCTHHNVDVMMTYTSLLQQELQQSLHTQTYIGISQSLPAKHISSFHNAYLQAARSVEQIKFQRTSKIAAYDDKQQPPMGVISYLTELMQTLELTILRNDAATIETIIEQIQHDMTSKGIPSHIVRIIYINTMSILFNTLERFQRDDEPALHKIEFVFQNRYSLQQMLSIMTDTSNKLCEIIRSTLSLSKQSTREHILSFVDKHWQDADLSLQFIAGHFNMSSSNFSYHFKKTIGYNFKEYIDQIRIQHSMSFLKNCDDSVEQIAFRIGYLNSSSFIRAFKKIVGVTPGQYREHNR